MFALTFCSGDESTIRNRVERDLDVRCWHRTCGRNARTLTMQPIETRSANFRRIVENVAVRVFVVVAVRCVGRVICDCLTRSLGELCQSV